MKVILSGLLDSSWGNFHRSTIVRLTVYGNYVKIGVGEGSIHQWELDVLRDTPIKREWINIEMPAIAYIEGIKYIPEKKTSGMPRGLLPVKSRDVSIFVSDKMRMIFPAYRCFDINFGEQRILSILSPKTLVKDISETTHPAFPKEKYHGRVHNVEVKAEALSRFFKADYGIGMLGKRDIVRGEVKAFPLLGREDVKVILSNMIERFGSCL
jgi:hypothetical protein